MTLRGQPVEPPFGCSSNLDGLGGVIRKARERGAEISYESAMSDLTCAIGKVERCENLTPEQITRVRQAVVRLSNLERKLSRG